MCTREGKGGKGGEDTAAVAMLRELQSWKAVLYTKRSHAAASTACSIRGQSTWCSEEGERVLLPSTVELPPVISQ